MENSDRRGFFKRLLGLGAMVIAAPMACSKPEVAPKLPPKPLQVGGPLCYQTYPDYCYVVTGYTDPVITSGSLCTFTSTGTSTLTVYHSNYVEKS